MDWTFTVGPRGLVWVNAEGDQPAFRETLNDSVSTLAPRGRPARLSTWWIDRVLERLDEVLSSTGDGVIGGGNFTSLRVRGAAVLAEAIYETFEEDSMSISEFKAGLAAWRTVVEERVRVAGDRVADDAFNYQRNPG